MGTRRLPLKKNTVKGELLKQAPLAFSRGFVQEKDSSKPAERLRMASHPGRMWVASANLALGWRPL